MPIPEEKPTPLSLAAWIDFTIGNGATIVIPRRGTTDLIFPDDAPAWLTELSFNANVRSSSLQKPCRYLPRILDATIGVLAAARRLGIVVDCGRRLCRRLSTTPPG